ncbi:PAS domain-containing protein [Phormidium sp. CCY1219]|uniref:PAS domain-containing protein n=1 Tax=Phormidium sp. CCY1219 TaxID=2886104 RepID=UPI002D1EFED4|nr:PAS domain-containing protein [Phormidium sp. CCY1219]MEB3827453.1 PAS domain-containing protein [Phormidium sp. CCY1219]
MVQQSEKTLWELLWEYDPNGLIVVNSDMTIAVVNPAFCKMFQVNREEMVGQNAADFFGDVSDLQRVWENNEVIRGKEKEFPSHNLYLRQVIFSIQDQNAIACIMVDITHEWQRKKELLEFKRETVAKVNEVVDNQMKVAQEIAGLLGETTAETKVSLLKILKLVEGEMF